MTNTPHPSSATVRSETVLDSSLPTPLYHQLYLILKKQIQDGNFTNGALLPTEAKLCSIYETSRITVKRALSELAAEGIISRWRGRGTVVHYAKSGSFLRSSFSELMENLQNINEHTTVEVLSASTVNAPSDVADTLELKQGDVVRRVIRRRMIDGAPYAYSVTYMPTTVSQCMKEEAMEGSSLVQLLAEAGFPPKEAMQRITAVAADSAVADALDLMVDAPILKIDRTLRTDAMQPIQYISLYFRSDRYEYALVLPVAEGIE